MGRQTAARETSGPEGARWALQALVVPAQLRADTAGQEGARLKSHVNPPGFRTSVLNLIISKDQGMNVFL